MVTRSDTGERVALTTEDIESAMKKGLLANKKFLEKYRDRWNNGVERAKYVEEFLQNTSSLQVLEEEMLPSDICRTMSSLMFSMQMLLRYNIPDSNGDVTEDSQKRDKKFLHGYMDDFLELRAIVEIKKICTSLMDSLLNGEVEHRFTWSSPSSADPGSGPLAYFKQITDKKVLEKVKFFLEWKGFELTEDTSPHDEFRIFTISWMRGEALDKKLRSFEESSAEHSNSKKTK